MKKELQRKINTLVDMAGVKSSYDAIIEELSQLDKEIEVKTNKVKLLKKNMQDDKYKNENERIIDENIKIGLENKKQQYNKELDDVINKLEKVSEEEENIHQMKTQNQDRISSLNHLLESVELKLRSVHQDEKLNQFYENMIDSINKELNEELRKNNILESKYVAIQSKLDYYGNLRFDLEAKLLKLDGKLQETLESLQNPNSYIDTELRDNDIKLVDNYNKELEELEKRKKDLVCEPVYLARRAIDLYDEDDIVGSLKEIKKIVDVVKLKPYVNSSKEQLKELLEQQISARDEFANYISNKSYVGVDFEVIDKRIDYLKNVIKDLEEEKKSIKKKIEDIDLVKVLKVSEELENAKVLAGQLKDEYDSYRQLVYFEDESVSPRKKATMMGAYHRKKEELDAINMLVNCYQKELEDLIVLSRKLDTENIRDIDLKINDCKEEIEELKNKKNNYTHAKDVLQMERDKAHLKEIDQDVEQIEQVLKYNLSLDELYDEIVMGISPVKEKESTEDYVDDYDYANDDYVDLNQYRIDTKEEEDEVTPFVKFDDNLKPTELRRADKVEAPKRYRVVNVEALPSHDDKGKEKDYQYEEDKPVDIPEETNELVTDNNSEVSILDDGSSYNASDVTLNEPVVDTFDNGVLGSVSNNVPEETNVFNTTEPIQNSMPEEVNTFNTAEPVQNYTPEEMNTFNTTEPVQNYTPEEMNTFNTTEPIQNSIPGEINTFNTTEPVQNYTPEEMNTFNAVEPVQNYTPEEVNTFSTAEPVQNTTPGEMNTFNTTEPVQNYTPGEVNTFSTAEPIQSYTPGEMNTFNAAEPVQNSMPGEVNTFNAGSQVDTLDGMAMESGVGVSGPDVLNVNSLNQNNQEVVTQDNGQIDTLDANDEYLSFNDILNGGIQ